MLLLMRKKLLLVATAVIAFAVVSCQKENLNGEIDDPVAPTKEYVKEFAFTASSVGNFDADWHKYFVEHYGLMASGFASSASVVFLDNASLAAYDNDVLDFIEQGKICVFVKPNDNFANWLNENLPDISAGCGVLEADDVVFIAVTNDAIFIQHKDSVEEFDPKEHRAPDEVIEEDEESSDYQESLDDPLNYELVIEWMEEKINEHYLKLCDTKGGSIVPLPENDEYRKARHINGPVHSYKHDFTMQAKRLSFDLPKVETKGECAVQYIFTPLYSYQGQSTKDPGDYYLVERILTVCSSATEKWTGGCVRKRFPGLRWYARGGYLYKAEVESSLNITKANCTAELIGLESPQSQNNVTTYTSNYSENMGVKIAPSVSATTGTAKGFGVSLGDLFNWGKSYSSGKTATLKDFRIKDLTNTSGLTISHSAEYEAQSFPHLNQSKTQYGNAADLAVSTAKFPSHWIWHISGTADDETDVIGYISTNLNVTWGWSHRSSNSDNYNPENPYGPECTNKSTKTVKDIRDTLPAPGRISQGRIVLKNDSDNYVYGIKVIDNDSKKVYFSGNTGTISPGKELILTAVQNNPQTKTPINYTIECEMGPDGRSLKTYKYKNDHYNDHFSVSKCVDKDRDSFNISIKSDMVEK